MNFQSITNVDKPNLKLPELLNVGGSGNGILYLSLISSRIVKISFVFYFSKASTHL